MILLRNSQEMIRKNKSKLYEQTCAEDYIIE